MTKVPIALFSRRSDAEPYQRRLSEAGIQAQLHDCSTLHGARLEVPAPQFEQAYEHMLNWDTTEHGIHGAIRCPECRSLRIDFPQYTHKSMLPNMLVGLLTNVGAMRKEFYCNDCHFTWPREGTKASLVHPENAPYYFVEGVPQSQPSERQHV